MGFDNYLVSVGFEHTATISPPSEGPQGFRRTIRLFTKPDVEEVEAEAHEAEVEQVPKKRKSQEEAKQGGELCEEDAPKAKSKKKRKEAQEQQEKEDHAAVEEEPLELPKNKKSKKGA